MLRFRRLVHACVAGTRGFAGKPRTRKQKADVELETARQRPLACSRSSANLTAGAAQAEELRVTMRKLAFLVHPDRASGLTPAAAAENAESLSQLQARACARRLRALQRL